jgi:hypothetical protein
VQRVVVLTGCKNVPPFLRVYYRVEHYLSVVFF